jgi:hypothetical protein
MPMDHLQLLSQWLASKKTTARPYLDTGKIAGIGIDRNAIRICSGDKADPIETCAHGDVRAMLALLRQFHCRELERA